MRLRLGFLRRRSTESSISARPSPEEAQKWAESFTDLMASKCKCPENLPLEMYDVKQLISIVVAATAGSDVNGQRFRWERRHWSGGISITVAIDVVVLP